MCGIFGIIRPSGIPEEWLEQLGTLNTARGNIAFGGLVWSPNSSQIFRFVHPFDAAKISVVGAHVILAHIRAPTGGQSEDIREVHPFETPDFFLAHNGILLNHADFAHWRLESNLAVDSQVIAVRQLDGQQGCWLWAKRKNALYMWRVMSSLYYSYQLGCFIFSSVKCELADQLLSQGIVCEIDCAASQFVTVAKFPFYSPYKVD